MNKHLFRVFTTVLFPAVAFAVDGVTLINQSTVLAAGGFPYTITTAGSYKLSGNLVASAGKQAILVAATNVVLDLAGFNVACTLGQNNTNQDFNCVGDSGATPSGITDVSIRNGTVTLTQTANSLGNGVNVAVGFLGSSNIIAEHLHIEAIRLGGPLGPAPSDLEFGVHSIIRHNILSGSGGVVGGIIGLCPSLLEGNINGPFTQSAFSGCVLVNNVGIL